MPIKSIYFQNALSTCFEKQSYTQPVSALALSICISPTWSLKTSYAPQDANGQQSEKDMKKQKHRSPRISMAASSPSNRPRFFSPRGPMIGNGNCISTSC